MSFGKSFSRNVVTPVTIVLFVVSTVTGIMLMVRWNASLVRFSHEWLSIGFSAIALWHLVRNWNAFLGYFRRHAALAAFVISLGASIVITGMTGSPSNSGGPGVVIRAMSGATLATAAPVFGMDTTKAIAVLQAANIEANGGDTLAAIGTRAGMNAVGVASILARQGRGN